MSKRTTISNGIRWFRYLLIPVIVELVGATIENPEKRLMNLALVLFFVLVFYLLYKSTRTRFDNEFLYKISGNKEKAIPLKSFVNIEHSGAKVNGTRMWNFYYSDTNNRQRKLHLLEGAFQHGSINEVIKLIQMVNPEVTLERSHFWAQVNKSLNRKKNNS